VLFALQLGQTVIGVTDYCTFPEAAAKLPRVGAYLNPNYELMLRLTPSMVLLTDENLQVQEFLKARHIEFLSFDHQSLAGIIQSIREIGSRFGQTRLADSIAARIAAEIRPESFAGRLPRVLLCAERSNPGAGIVTKAYIAGPKTFFDQLIRASGGANAYADSNLLYPALSAEGIVRLQPDIIIDVTASMGKLSASQMAADWYGLRSIPAVRDSLVICLTDSYITIPGPRVVETLRQFKRIVQRFGERRAAGKGAFHF
jgi:iron complex transport system substrate-binding protein